MTDTGSSWLPSWLPDAVSGFRAPNGVGRHSHEGTQLESGLIVVTHFNSSVYGSPVATADALTDGAAITLARSDHAHRVPGIKTPAATFPGSPVEGDLFYETDTDKLWAWDEANWVELGRTGAWTTFTPTVKFGATAASIQNDSRWVRSGTHITAYYAMRFTNLNGGTGTLTFTLPVSHRTVSDPANFYAGAMGTGGLIDLSNPGVNLFSLFIHPNTAADAHVRTSASPSVALTNTVPITIAVGGNGTGDEFYATVVYEAAASV